MSWHFVWVGLSFETLRSQRGRRPTAAQPQPRHKAHLLHRRRRAPHNGAELVVRLRRAQGRRERRVPDRHERADRRRPPRAVWFGFGFGFVIGAGAAGGRAGGRERGIARGKDHVPIYLFIRPTYLGVVLLMMISKKVKAEGKLAVTDLLSGLMRLINGLTKPVICYLYCDEMYGC